MRKVLMVLLLAVIVSPAFAGRNESAAEERVYCYDESAIKPNAYFDLSQTLYLPRYGTNWGADGSNPDYGTYGDKNYIGQFGCALTGYAIEFTVQSDGHFTSQSDPTKYRNFFLALRPRIRINNTPYVHYYDDGTDVNYLLGSNGTLVSTDERLPNTRANGVVSYVAPAYTTEDNYRNIGPGTNNFYYVSRFWCDMLVCMDELTPAELQHMSDANDYVAMVTVSWRCIDPACETPEKYNGSYTFVLHGHFNDSDPVNRQISMYVNPTADSMKLDLATILAAETEEGRQRKIADLNLYCSSRNDNWKDRLFLFLSSNPNYNATGSTFRLVGETNRNKSIPFKILVKNSDGSGNRVFEGDGTYTKRKSDCIEIPNSCIQVLQDRLTALHYSVLFESDVYISFESGIDIDALPSDIYESYIYYHIVYADSNLVN